MIKLKKIRRLKPHSGYARLRGSSRRSYAGYWLHNEFSGDVSYDLGVNKAHLTNRASSTTEYVTSSFGSVGIQGSANANDGFAIPSTEFSTNGWGELTLGCVIYSDGHVLSDANEDTLFREATSTDAGVSLSFLGTNVIRAIIQTDGTSTWTDTQDSTIDATPGYYLFAMVYDGSQRHVYQGVIGGKIQTIRSDTCTGSIVITSQASSSFVVQGGLYTLSRGYDSPQVLSFCSDRAFSINELDDLCKNPFRDLTSRSYFLPAIAPAAGATIPPYMMYYARMHK